MMIEDILKSVALSKYCLLSNSNITFKLGDQSFYSVCDAVVLIHD